MTSIKLLLSAVMFMFIACSLAGDSESTAVTQAKQVTLKFPANGRPQLQGGILMGSSDAITTRYLVLANNAITIKMPFIVGWTAASPVAQESFALTKEGVKAAPRLSFAIYDKNEFLSDLSGDTLNAYKNLLIQQYGKSITFLNEKDNFQVPNSFFILNKDYRIFDYTLAKVGGEVERVIEYIVFPNLPKCYLIIIKLSGEENWVAQQIPQINDSLRFSHIEDSSKIKQPSAKSS